MSEFQHIVDELAGKRCVYRGLGKILVHYGDVTDPQDPRWFVTDKDTMKQLAWDGLAAWTKAL